MLEQTLQKENGLSTTQVLNYGNSSRAFSIEKAIGTLIDKEMKV